MLKNNWPARRRDNFCVCGRRGEEEEEEETEAMSCLSLRRFRAARRRCKETDDGFFCFF